MAPFLVCFVCNYEVCLDYRQLALESCGSKFSHALSAVGCCFSMRELDTLHRKYVYVR